MTRKDVETMISLIDDKFIEEAAMDERRAETDKTAKLRPAGGWQKRRKTAVAAALGLLLCSGTAAAGVHSYYVHMQSMSTEEKKQLMQGAQSATAAADSYSRELTKSEWKRYEQLQQSYEEGQYPEGEIKEAATADQIGSYETQIWYCDEEGRFYLPQATLTDEQLLEMIDFNEKRDYVLSEAARKNAKEETETKGKLSTQTCKKQAQMYLTKLQGLSVKKASFEVKTKSVTGEKEKNVYDVVRCTSPEWEHTYIVRFNDDTGIFYDLAVEDIETFMQQDQVTREEDVYRVQGQKVRERVKAAFGEEMVENTVMLYDCKGEAAGDTVWYITRLTNGRYIFAEYSPKRNEVYNTMNLTNQMRQWILGQHKKALKKKGWKYQEEIITEN